MVCFHRIIMHFAPRRLIILMSMISMTFTYHYMLLEEIEMNDNVMTSPDNYLRFFHTYKGNPHKNRGNHSTTANNASNSESSSILMTTTQHIYRQDINSYNNKIRNKINLRYDWTNLTPSLDLTKRIIQYQSNCSLPMSTFTHRNRFGLGSDLHVYSQALCNGISLNQRIRTVGNWTWTDQRQFRNENVSSEIGSCILLGSPMRCYFATSELNCPGDVEYAIENPEFDSNQSLSRANGNVLSSDCLSVLLPSEKDIDVSSKTFQTAVIESLFTRLTSLVVEEAERQLNLVFGGNKVPKDLITVHIRWGDKVATFQGKRRKRMPEMKKVDISDYIEAVYQIVGKRNEKQMNGDINIFLATEDPKAVEEFRQALPTGWNLFVDQFWVETNPHRIDEYNGIPKMAQNALHGKAGLLAMGSLLVSMEANDFVLTTASNWSRLIDELRLSILNPRCGNCTSTIDLRQ